MCAATLRVFIRLRQGQCDMDELMNRIRAESVEIDHFAFSMQAKYPRMSDLTRMAIEFIYADMNQSLVNFYVIFKPPSSVDILIWLDSDPSPILPCMMITLPDLIAPHGPPGIGQTVRYYVPPNRIKSGMAAIRHIPKQGYINSHRGLDGEYPCAQNVIIKDFHEESMKALRDLAEGMSDPESDNSDEGMDGGPSVCGE